MAKSLQEEYLDIVSEIKSNKAQPFYVLDGEETYYMDKLEQVIENELVDASLKDYCLFTYYGKDVTWDQIYSACFQTTFVSDRIIVILKEAQDLKDFNKLEKYFLSPSKHCLLLVLYKNKKIDGKTKVYKAIKSNGIYWNCKPMYDNQIAPWILSYSKSINHPIKPIDAELLFSYLGNNLSKIVNEIGKITINLRKDDPISGEHIEKYIGISNEYNIFQFTNAISKRDTKLLYNILNYSKGNPKAFNLIGVIANLQGLYIRLITFHQFQYLPQIELSKMMGVHIAFLKDYIQAASHISLQKAQLAIVLLYEYNKKALGIKSRANDIELLQELSFRLIY